MPDLVLEEIGKHLDLPALASVMLICSRMNSLLERRQTAMVCKVVMSDDLKIAFKNSLFFRVKHCT